jgi:hypothetical protein
MQNISYQFLDKIQNHSVIYIFEPAYYADEIFKASDGLRSTSMFSGTGMVRQYIRRYNNS